MTKIAFAELGLAEPLLRTLSARKYDAPTPIQAQAIPLLLQGRDVLGIAQTGTGKTASFALPILQDLFEHPSHKKSKNPRALILAPTRELASQIDHELRAYGKEIRFRAALVFGGVRQGRQVDALQRGVEVVIATPGRLLDLVNQRHLSLAEIDFLVLDEADRMLDMGFIQDIRKIIAALPKDRQTLMFSATMPTKIAALSADMQTDPARVEVAVQSTPVERIAQTVHHVREPADKRRLLVTIMQDPDLARVIVFTRTKHRADRVAGILEKNGIKAVAIHGNKSQNARQRALNMFKSGNARVLVATDIAARGIDIDGVTHVVNFELPNEPESYVHRIGRTARAGAVGAAISLCDPTERSYLGEIEKTIRMKLQPADGAAWSPLDDALDAAVSAPPARPKRRKRRGKGTRPNASQAGQPGAAKPKSAGRPRRRARKRAA